MEKNKNPIRERRIKMEELDLNELRKLRDRLNKVLEEEKENKEDKITVGKVVDSTIEIMKEKKESFISSILTRAAKAQRRREIEKKVEEKMKEVEENIRKSIPKS